MELRRCAPVDIPEPAEPAAEEAGTPDLPAVTLSDIASFRPQSATLVGEPQGWAIIGLDANFIATAPQHERAGDLLGRPASVRFSPVAFHWDYGDGTTRSSATGGARWQALGLAEFDSTATSHRYRTRGGYTVRVSVEYAAAYRYQGAGWTPVPGTLTVPSAALPLTVVDTDTVLVNRDCGAAPYRSLGC